MPNPDSWSWHLCALVACLAAFAAWGLVLVIGWAVYSALRG